MADHVHVPIDLGSAPLGTGGDDQRAAFTSLNLDMSFTWGAIAVDTSTFTVTFTNDIVVGATKRVYLDGGSDSYIRESSADNIQIVTGGLGVVDVNTITTNFVRGNVAITEKNLLVGGTTVPASAISAITIFNGTAPTGSVANGVVLYSEDVTASAELKVRDEAGNVTTLSPHNASLLPNGKFSEDMGFGYYSEKRVMIDVDVPEETITEEIPVMKTIIVDDVALIDGVPTIVDKEVKVVETEPKELIGKDGKPAKDKFGKVRIVDVPITETKTTVIPAHTIKQDTGAVKKINVDILKMMRLVEAQSGEKLVYEAS